MSRRQVLIDTSSQTLSLFDGDHLLSCFNVSTAKNGLGELRDSECTPRGLHYVRAKIGAGLDPATVFVGRRPTGELYTPDLAVRQGDRDWILGRIFWLCGREKGVNRLGQVDSMRRYIYIHGSPDSCFTGYPASHGCIRMRMKEVCLLFELLQVGDNVMIK